MSVQLQPNPFKPGFGNSPPVLAGRQRCLDEFVEALDDGPGAFGRMLLLSGQRGCGKTVMLNALEDEDVLRHVDAGTDGSASDCDGIDPPWVLRKALLGRPSFYLAASRVVGLIALRFTEKRSARHRAEPYTRTQLRNAAPRIAVNTPSKRRHRPALSNRRSTQ